VFCSLWGDDLLTRLRDKSQPEELKEVYLLMNRCVRGLVTYFHQACWCEKERTEEESIERHCAELFYRGPAYPAVWLVGLNTISRA